MRTGAAIIGFLVCAAVGFAVGYSAGRNAGGAPKPSSSSPSPPVKPPPVQGGSGKLERVPIGDSPVRGPINAPVTIVEFSELGCAFCTRASALMKTIEAKLGGDVRFVWKTTGRSTRPDLALATELALAATDQDKFWPLHARFATASDIDETKVRAAAKELGLDPDVLLAEGRGHERVAADRELAEKLAITDTPMFFINGERTGVLESVSQLERVIEAARNRARAVVAAGVPPEGVYAQLMQSARDPLPPRREARPPPAADARVQLTPAKHAPRRGAEGARVLITMFSDFTSPFAASAKNVLDKVLEKFPAEVEIELRHLPASQNDRAIPAAKAAIAAHLQGAFWKYHDRLFAAPQALDDQTFTRYAKELGLDAARFERDRKLSAADAILDRDRQEAARLAVRGTPAFFINGLPLRGAQSYETFVGAIEAELARPAPIELTPKIDTTIAPRRGAAGAKVEVVVFNDFQCPACKGVPPLVDRLLSEHAKELAVVYKQYPLPMHPHAELASVAALAAHRQGKFVEMHDRLFANQSALSREDLVAHARAIGLDAARFSRELDDPTLRRAVKADISEGVKLGVTGTPTIFIGPKRLEGLKTYEEVATAVKMALRSSG